MVVSGNRRMRSLNSDSGDHIYSFYVRICYFSVRIYSFCVRICYFSVRIYSFCVRICYFGVRVCYFGVRIYNFCDRVCYFGDYCWLPKAHIVPSGQCG
ncbi:hypothetical protein [Nostoc sp.]|uniref:hypothetical protein n=1 Tax=Nostoc sp. TaxID=1180 RepID=UPI002FF99AEE